MFNNAPWHWLIRIHRFIHAHSFDFAFSECFCHFFSAASILAWCCLFSFVLSLASQLKAKNKRYVRQWVRFFSVQLLRLFVVFFLHRPLSRWTFLSLPVEDAVAGLRSVDRLGHVDAIHECSDVLLFESHNFAVDSNSRLQFINVVYVHNVVIYSTTFFSLSVILSRSNCRLKPFRFNRIIPMCMRRVWALWRCLKAARNASVFQ